MTQRRAALGLQIVGLAVALADATAIGLRALVLVVAVIMFVVGSALEDRDAGREGEH